MLFLLASLALPTVQANCAHGTYLAPFNDLLSEQVKTSTFSYTGEKGPLNWFGLNETANAMCAEGKHQSPINLDSAVAQFGADPSTFNFSVQDLSNATFENLGTNVEVIAGGSLTVNGTEYELAQFHFHVPSEHRFDDEIFLMEMHYVFQTKNGSIAVVGFVIDSPSTGYTSPLLADLFSSVKDIGMPGNVTTTGPLSFDDLTKHVYQYPLYTYEGSLTTPPCSESVLWYISSHPLWIDIKLFNDVKKVVKFNARYSQNSLSLVNLLTEAGEELKNASALRK